MNRRDVASWLAGPRAAAEDATVYGYRGERLGLAETGPGSVAGFGRRFVALVIDWWVAVAIALGLFNLGQSWIVVIFTFEYVLLLSTLGYTIGMRLLGIRVANLSGGLPGPLGTVVRTLLLVLVIPAVIYDRDGRGLHDRAAGTVVLRR